MCRYYSRACEVTKSLASQLADTITIAKLCTVRLTGQLWLIKKLIAVPSGVAVSRTEQLAHTIFASIT